MFFGLNVDGMCISVNQLDVAQHKLPIYENGIRSGASLIRCEFHLICVFSHRCIGPIFFFAIQADRLHFVRFLPPVAPALGFRLSARSEFFKLLSSFPIPFQINEKSHFFHQTVDFLRFSLNCRNDSFKQQLIKFENNIEHCYLHISKKSSASIHALYAN